MEKIYVNNLSETTDKYEVVRPLFDWNTLEVEFIYKSDFVITKDLRDFVEVTWEILWLPKDVIARISMKFGVSKLWLMGFEDLES